jgi:hypothetical protein
MSNTDSIPVEQTRGFVIAVKKRFVEHVKIDDFVRTKICVPLNGSGLSYWNRVLVTLKLEVPIKYTGKHGLARFSIESGYIVLTKKPTITYDPNCIEVFTYNDNNCMISPFQFEVVFADSYKVDDKTIFDCPLRGISVDNMDKATLTVIVDNYIVQVDTISVKIQGWSKTEEYERPRNESNKLIHWTHGIRELQFSTTNRMYPLYDALKNCDALIGLNIFQGATLQSAPRAQVWADGMDTGILINARDVTEASTPFQWVKDKIEASNIYEMAPTGMRDKILLVPSSFRDIFLVFYDDIVQLNSPLRLEIKEVKLFGLDGATY